MLFVVTRASNNILEIKDFASVADLIQFQKEQQNPIILQENYWFQENPQYLKKWHPHVDANTIVTIPYELKIYDDYIE